MKSTLNTDPAIIAIVLEDSKGREFFKAIAAGVCIGLGAMMKCAVDRPITGAVLFSLGLLCVCMFQLNLYTGKVAYHDTYPSLKTYFNKMCFYFVGNIFGVICISWIYNTVISDAAYEISSHIGHMPLWAIASRSIMCGAFVYTAVEGYHRHQETCKGVICLILCVVGFIICGGRHCIADMAYMMLSLHPSYGVALRILLAALGNGAGAIVMRECLK